MADSIDIVISDKIDSSIESKLESIAASALTADSALTRLKNSLALINTSPINALKQAVDSVNTSIDKNALSQQKLATETAKTATATANAATAQQKLQTETEKTATAAQRLATEQQRTAAALAQAEAAQNRAAITAIRLEEAQNRGEGTTRRFGLSWLQMTTSMAAGMLTYQAVQGVFEAIRFVTLGSIEAIDDLKVSTIQTAAILTSLADNQTDIASTYKQASKYAEDLNVTLQKVDANTTLNLKNLQTITQEMAKQGVTLDVNNQKQVDDFTKLANAVALYSRNGKDERQVRQEVKALLEGEVRQGDELAKLLDRITNGHLKDYMQQWKQIGYETGNQGYAIEQIGKYLTGFGPATADMQKTWSAVTSSIETAASILQRAFFKNIFGDIVSSGEDFQQWLKDSEPKIEKWGNNFLRIIYSIQAEILRMGMLADKAGGTMTSAQMLLYGPGKAIGYGPSVKRFDTAAQNNMNFEQRYNEKDKMLQDLAVKMNKIDALDAEIDKVIAAGSTAKAKAPKLGMPGPTVEEIRKAEKEWEAYSAAYDQLNQRLAENDPELTKLQKALNAVDVEVNAAVRRAPTYADSLRQQGELVKEQIKLREQEVIALAKVRTETKLLEDDIKNMAKDFAPHSKNGLSQVGMGLPLQINQPLQWKPKANKYSLTGAPESGFATIAPTDEELLRMHKSNVELELARAKFRLILGDGKAIDVLHVSVGKLLDGYTNLLDGLTKSFGDFFQSLENGFADSIGHAIVYGDSLRDSLRNVSQEILSTLISSLIKLGIQYALNAALGNSIAAASTAASVAQAGVISAAWSTPAALVSLATEGTNSIPAMTALVSTTSLAKFMSVEGAAGFESGGYTGNLGTKQIAGVVHGQEFVVNAPATAKNRDLLEAMNRGEDVNKPTSSRASGAVNVSIHNYGTSKQFQVQQVSENEVRIIAKDEARRAVADHAPKVIASEIKNPNSTVSKSMDRYTQTQRRR